MAWLRCPDIKIIKRARCWIILDSCFDKRTRQATIQACRDCPHRGFGHFVARLNQKNWTSLDHAPLNYSRFSPQQVRRINYSIAVIENLRRLNSSRIVFLCLCLGDHVTYTSWSTFLPKKKHYSYLYFVMLPESSLSIFTSPPFFNN